ncbi:MAG: tagaturonate reductase [bacterium]|nr:tagaturonate reductase [bacterium]
MNQLSRKTFSIPVRDIHILQFGEGNFLRAFVDNFIQVLNDQSLINSNICVVQPVAFGRVKELSLQDGLYTLFLEGMQDGQIVKTHRIIDVLSDFINPYTQLDAYLSYARNPKLQVIFSNTTEAGIVFVEELISSTSTPDSFPGKLLLFLLERFHTFQGSKDVGLDIVACELIDHNGDELKRVLLELAHYNNLSDDFIRWVKESNRFYNTLVDRIVPGYPKDNSTELAEQLGYLDHSMVKGEIFHLWVIEGPTNLQKILPFEQSGQQVFYVDSIQPYKQRKVKILNGSHTALVPIAYLMGERFVKESIETPLINQFIKQFVFQEVVPTISLPEAEMTSFATSVFERYQNPFVKHQLLSIALNSISKFKSRILPTIIDFHQQGGFPKHALFAFAALLVFYKGVTHDLQTIPLQDEERFLVLFSRLWALNNISELVHGVVSLEFFECEYLQSQEVVQFLIHHVSEIVSKGMASALQNFLKG